MAEEECTGPGIIHGSERPLSQAYQLALLDLDGVVYRGADPVENAAAGIDQAKDLGMKIAYTTNNPSRFPLVVADQIRSFGLELEDSDVITSAIVSAHMMEEALKPGSTVLVIGAKHLRDELEKVGFKVTDLAADHPQAVIQSWYPTISWQELSQATYAIQSGARYFATNRDLTIPREGGIAPGNGAMLLPVIAASGKEPEASAGKPEPFMYDIALTMFSDTDRPLDRQICLPVGDRLDTDIEAANRGGYDGAVVLTGVADPRQIILAAPINRPVFVCADLEGLNDPQPEVRVSRGNGRLLFTCRQAKAWVDSESPTIPARLHVVESGSPAKESGNEPAKELDSLDALRAAASAAWHALDSGLDPTDLRLPAFAAKLH